jgi:2-hydroxy-3-oxopropionate reductase
MSETSVGFVGLGVMGDPMARRLAAAGFSVRAYRVRAERAPELKQAGVEAADSPRDATGGARFIITMLPDTHDVEGVLLGPNGIIDALGPGQIFIDMSTISPSGARRMAEAVSKTGAMALDAPVSGGVVGARDGGLSIMVGGEASAFKAAQVIFDTLGRTITHVGGSGLGQAAKLCNQVVVAMNLQAICEAFALGSSQGLDLSSLRSVLSAGAAGSWMIDNLGPLIISGDSSPGFRIALQLKDLRLALDAAQAKSIPLPGTALAASLYTEACAHGEASNGNQGLFRVYERLSNQSFRSRPLE